MTLLEKDASVCLKLLPTPCLIGCWIMTSTWCLAVDEKREERNETRQRAQERIVLTVAAKDRVVFDGDSMPLSKLTGALKARAKVMTTKKRDPAKDAVVIIRAAKNTRAGLALQAIRACQEAGFTSYALRVFEPAKRRQSRPLRVEFPMKLRVDASHDGGIRTMQLNGLKLQTLSQLQVVIRQISKVLPNVEGKPTVEINIDPQLQYLHVVQIVTAVAGYRDENGKLVRVFKEIKFVRGAKSKKTAADDGS